MQPVGVYLRDVLRDAEILDRVDVAVFVVEHRVAAVAAQGSFRHRRETRVVGGDRRHDDPSAVDAGHVFPGVEPPPRGPLFEGVAQRVDHVALEPVSRTEEFVDHEPLRERRVDPVEADRVDPHLRRDRLAADALDAVVDEQLGVGQPREVAAHQARELGIDLADAGDEPQPDLVAQVFGRAVRRILPEGDAVLHGVFEYLPARGEQQRADDLPHLGRNARQSPQPGAAQQVDEKGLYRVVGVVGDGHGRIAVLMAQGVEPGVA